MIRTIARGVARRRMKKAGYTKICKARNQCASPKQMRNGDLPDEKRSLFANNWRKFA